jgi:hypothetical protein
MTVEFKNSAAALNRRDFCKQYGLESADDFYGFTYNDVGFLYRRASISSIRSRQKKYLRLEWKNPLGGRIVYQYRYVVFHIPKTKQTDERFYIKSISEIAAQIRRYPLLEKKINVAYDPLEPRADQQWREWFLENPVDPQHFKATLERLTK